MNLLVKNYIFPIFIISILGVFACNKANKVGQELKPQDIGVIFTDTVTVKTSTILLDSVETANVATFLTGNYTDPIFGKIKASTYLSLQPVTGDINLGSNPIFIDGNLEITYSYAYGNKSVPLKLNVYQLSKKIDSSKVYHQFDTHPYDATPIGSLSFKTDIKLAGELITIPLTNDFITAFSNFIKPRTTLSLSDLDGFVKGLAIVPENSDSFIMGFEATRALSIRLLFKYKNDNTTTEQFFNLLLRIPTSNLIVNNRYGSVSFNSVQADRTGTILQNLNSPNNTIPSQTLANQTFLQESIGIATLVEFPYLKDFANIPNIAINKADLIVRPIPETVTDNLKRINELEWVTLTTNKYRKKVTNQSIDPSTGTQINNNVTVGLGREDAPSQKLSALYEIFSNSYNSEITTYFQFLINSYNTSYTGVNKRENNGLHLRSSLEGSRAGRMVIGGQKSQYPIQLRVFYTKKL
jgi:Domain of unknown function (DUF4270)